jgi:hypothetical protein
VCFEMCAAGSAGIPPAFCSTPPAHTFITTPASEKAWSDWSK